MPLYEGRGVKKEDGPTSGGGKEEWRGELKIRDIFGIALWAHYAATNSIATSHRPLPRMPGEAAQFT